MPRWQRLRPLSDGATSACSAPISSSVSATRASAPRRSAGGRSRLGRPLREGRRGIALAPGDVRVDDGGVEIRTSGRGRGDRDGDGVAGHSFAWTAKQADRPARGTVRVDGRVLEVDARAIVDVSAGYHPRHTAWKWSAGVGSLADGRSVGWNLVSGIHDSPQASERTIWVDGAPAEWGPSIRRRPGVDPVRGRCACPLQRMGRAPRPHQPARDAQLLPPAVRNIRGRACGRLPGRGLRCDGRASRVVVTSPTSIVRRWQKADEQRLLQVVQPGLIGLIDGTISTLAPIRGGVYRRLRAALLVGLAAALGAAISMGLRGAPDDGTLTGRGSPLVRGLITGGATFVGGTMHALPFLIDDVNKALALAYVVVTIELMAIALIRKRFLQVSLAQSLIQVTLGGAWSPLSAWSSGTPDATSATAAARPAASGSPRSSGSRGARTARGCARSMTRGRPACAPGHSASISNISPTRTRGPGSAAARRAPTGTSAPYAGDAARCASSRCSPSARTPSRGTA